MSERDISASVRRSVLRTPLVYATLGSTLLTVPILLLLRWLAQSSLPELWSVIPVIALLQLGLVAIGLFLLFGAPALAASRAKDSGVLGAWVVTFAPDEFSFATPVMSGSYEWSFVDAVHSHPSGLYLALKQGSTFAIPRHAFADESAFASADEWINYYIASARDLKATGDPRPHA